MRRALITGLSGTTLKPAEREFLANERPLGIILFKRNVDTHDQIKALIGAAKQAIDADDVLVLIDQEGGRVQRLRPPLGRALPPARAYAQLYGHDPGKALTAAYLAARLLSEDLKKLGINCNCAPVVDVPVKGAHEIIGDRAYGATPAQVTAFGRAVAQGFMHGSVLPVMKHIPGHGRATADSHHALPVVDTSPEQLAKTDFMPFAQLHDIPAAMTAHVVYSALDATAPATTSHTIIQETIRGQIAFAGLLMCDDLSMKALGGPIHERAKAAISAGCDVALHCNGDLKEMREAAKAVPALKQEPLNEPAYRRFQAAIDVVNGISACPFDESAACDALGAVLAGYSGAQMPDPTETA